MNAKRETPRRLTREERFNKTNKHSAKNENQIIQLLRANRLRSAALVYQELYGYSFEESQSAVIRLAGLNGIKIVNNTAKIVLLIIAVAVVIGAYSFYISQR